MIRPDWGQHPDADLLSPEAMRASFRYIAESLGVPDCPVVFLPRMYLSADGCLTLTKPEEEA